MLLQPINISSLEAFLNYWSTHSKKPIVIFFDEIDSLIGDSLISVLRQLRSGYANRPEHFPQSVCLFGVRDVRDYRIWSDEQQAMVLGGSAFNIKAESLTLPDFSLEQVRYLYEQHTESTGQHFTDEAIDYAFYLTQGQPWLVNALAYQACFRDVTDRSKPITKEVIERSKEVLIQRLDTHIDVLVDKLNEPRVRRIIDMVIAGTMAHQQYSDDDLQYVRDLGLITRKNIAIANPLYQEILPRALVYASQEGLPFTSAPYLDNYGNLVTQKLFEAFQQFYRENSAIWLEKFDYKESGPHLIMMAWLQRIINGGGKIHREYALGRERVDLLVEWKKQRIVIELKIMRSTKSVTDGLQQTVSYMDTARATEGHLIIFEPDTKKNWEEKVYHVQEQIEGKIIQVWDC